MIVLDEDSLICDLAETYHIFDYRALPLSLVGVLSCGLRENSRIKMKLSDRNVSTDTILLASIVDRLSLMLWKDTVDGHKNINKPQSLVEQVLDFGKQKEFSTFNTIEEFEQARRKILGE